MTFKELYGDKSNEVYNGNLDISNKNLTSLEGIYKKINGNFYCYNNQITSFEHCPDIKGDFYCNNNQITSFEHCLDVNGNFDCSNNQITDFTNKRYFKNIILDDLIMKKYIEYGKINFPQYLI